MPRGQVAVRLVGSLTVEFAGQPVTGVAIGSRKARQLLALLAVNPARSVSIDRAVELLWEDAPPRDPGHNVAAMVSRLRAVFGADLVTREGRGYRLGRHADVDLFQAVTLSARAEAAERYSEALAHARAALSLIGGGGVLEDEPYAVWAVPARAMQADILARVRRVAADAALRLDDVPLAREFAKAAVAADPLDDGACRLLMRTYFSAGETAKALLAYERLRRSLAADLGADPEPPTRELHLAILAGGSTQVSPSRTTGS